MNRRSFCCAKPLQEAPASSTLGAFFVSASCRYGADTLKARENHACFRRKILSIVAIIGAASTAPLPCQSRRSAALEAIGSDSRHGYSNNATEKLS